MKRNGVIVALASSHIWQPSLIVPDTTCISPSMLYACGNVLRTSVAVPPSSLPDRFDFVGASAFSSRARNLAMAFTQSVKSKQEPIQVSKQEPKLEPKQEPQE